MTIFRFSLGACLLAGPVLAQDVAVPSGITVGLFDVILEQSTPTARFRFLAPEIQKDTVDFATVADDFQYLCDNVVRPALAQNDWTEGDIVISYSAAELPFGEIAPDVTQFFQPFRLTEDGCQWEDY